MNFDKEAKSEIFCCCWGGGRGGGGGGTETKTVCKTVSNEVKYKMHLSTQCRVCGSINISKYDHNFFKHKTYSFYFEFPSK